jgi:putative transposase
MPARNSRKVYLEEGYYHLYNRGVEKRDIFLDNQDYETFLSYLQAYLTPKDTEKLTLKLADHTLYAAEKENIRRMLRLNNFSQDLTLLSYCLMPNHFHFFIKQKRAATIDRFMNSLGTRYTMYFNKKYKRVGTLYQSVYKAAALTSESQFLHLSRYIHKQSYKTQPCSYDDYIGRKKTPWVKPEEILSIHAKKYPNLTYEAFIKASDETIDSTAFSTLED